MSTDGDTTSELTTLEQQIIMHLQNTFGDGTEENFPAEADIDRVQTAYANLSENAFRTRERGKVAEVLTLRLTAIGLSE
jgi:hypothetical protein